ncbi:MAG: primosomal protein N' [Actinobacteria bacterium]|nr:primosomal protein N' [Actinomycetota bacterium]
MTAQSNDLRIASVYIQHKTRSLDHPFDYHIPDRLLKAVTTGSVVLVPLGRQKALGIIAGLKDRTSYTGSGLADIEELVDYPPVPERLIDLALWVSEHYYCSPASALGLVLPPGGLPALVKSGSGEQVRYTLKAPKVRPRRVRFVRLSGSAGEKDDAGEGTGREIDAMAGEKGSTDAQARVLAILQKEGELPLADLRNRAAVSSSPLKTLAARGRVEIFEREVRRDGLRYYAGQEPETGIDDTGSASAARKQKAHTLNGDQQEALDVIVTRLDSIDTRQRSRPVLLEGVAGAGKTEVYLCAIEAAVARGYKAIVLVPEISLTHQAVKRFRRRFGDHIGILHSGLSVGERYDEYSRIRSGEVEVVIGPRSALFAPLPKLGLIVIDEENDGSFKQENDPRYDARRVALERARLEGAALVYGSATPSLESYYRVTDRFTLRERATGAAMPEVEIVDMLEEKETIFSDRLAAEIDRNLGAGGKTILLLNSRGYARFLQCGHCGNVWKCDNCEVSLTIHSRIHRLLCHHCGYMEEMPDFCPSCRSTDLRRWGVGTEQLEDEVRRRFPEAPVFRLDADTARGYGAGPRILEDFGNAEGGILLGTQMVAKGHHFPDVTLAAVVNADLSLQFPEFRAEEQTFALLLQLSGRSGRAEKPGRVIIQTWNADIECIRMAANQAVEEFYTAELERRRRLGYPPFVQLVNILCLSRESTKSAKAAGFLGEKIEAVLSTERVLGPADLFRLKGWARSHILVKTDSIERTLAAMKPVIEHYRGPYKARGVRIVVDVDPQWLS